MDIFGQVVLQTVAANRRRANATYTVDASAAAQLVAHLSQDLKPLYTLHGDEPLLVEEAADAIREAARAAGHTERNVHTVAGAHFDWSAVLAAGGRSACSPSARRWKIRLPPASRARRAAPRCSRSPPAPGGDSTLTLVLLPRLDTNDAQRPWFAALERRASRSRWPRWSGRRCRSGSPSGWRGRASACSPGEEGQRTLQFFADRVEGNLLAAHQEIQKLGLLYPAGELGFAQVEGAVLNVARYDVFKLSEAVLAGQLAARAAHARRPAGRRRGRGAGALHAGRGHPRAEAREGCHGGRPPLPVALREQRVWGVEERSFERVLPRLSAMALDNLLQAAHVVDGIVKGLKVPDWPAALQALQRLAVALCQDAWPGATRAPNVPGRDAWRQRQNRA